MVFVVITPIHSRSLTPRQQRKCLFPNAPIDHLFNIARPRQRTVADKLSLHEFELVERERKVGSDDPGPRRLVEHESGPRIVRLGAGDFMGNPDRLVAMAHGKAQRFDLGRNEAGRILAPSAGNVANDWLLRLVSGPYTVATLLMLAVGVWLLWQMRRVRPPMSVGHWAAGARGRCSTTRPR